MSTPKRLQVYLSEYGYTMELDTKKDDCNREGAHWHLCKNGRRIGQITPWGSWTSTPTGVSASIRKEAEDMTAAYSREISDYYNYNRENGAD